MPNGHARTRGKEKRHGRATHTHTQTHTHARRPPRHSCGTRTEERRQNTGAETDDKRTDNDNAQRHNTHQREHAGRAADATTAEHADEAKERTNTQQHTGQGDSTQTTRTFEGRQGKTENARGKNTGTRWRARPGTDRSGGTGTDRQRPGKTKGKNMPHHRTHRAQIQVGNLNQKARNGENKKPR